MISNNYICVYDYLSANYFEVDGYNFYADIFPNNENEGEYCLGFSRPNAIYLYQDDRDSGTYSRLHRRIMLKNTWENDYVHFVEENPLTLCSGLSYRGLENTLNNAQKMNALIFDLDGVGLAEIRNLLSRFGKPAEWIRTLPMPTYIVLSGSGLHIYYVFDKPIDLYPNIKLQLKQLKYDLTFRMWEYGETSQYKAIQYQSINQGFRMVGSVNSKYDVVIKAFKIGDRVSLEYLNKYCCDEKNRVDINKPFAPTKITRAEAKEKYPDWYQRVVIEGNKNKEKWNIGYRKRTKVKDYALYEWWKQQVTQIHGGHRYFFLMCMAIYACKCDVPRDKLKEDMYDIFDILSKIEHSNSLTENEIIVALEAYDKEYYNFTIHDIEMLTEVRINRNKRNGRKQKIHLKIARATRDILHPNNDWINKNGRPSLEQQVIDWRFTHPQGKKADCIRDTGLSKPTVYKWWESAEKQVEKKVAEYMDKSNMVKLSFEEQQKMAQRIMGYVQKLALQRNISEEEAYKIYAERRRLQRDFDKFVFTKEGVTPELQKLCDEKGIILNIVSDRKYDEWIAKGFCEWLRKK